MSTWPPPRAPRAPRSHRSHRLLHAHHHSQSSECRSCRDDRPVTASPSTRPPLVPPSVVFLSCFPQHAGLIVACGRSRSRQRDQILGALAVDRVGAALDAPSPVCVRGTSMMDSVFFVCVCVCVCSLCQSHARHTVTTRHTRSHATATTVLVPEVSHGWIQVDGTGRLRGIPGVAAERAPADLAPGTMPHDQSVVVGAHPGGVPVAHLVPHRPVHGRAAHENGEEGHGGDVHAEP